MTPLTHSMRARSMSPRERAVRRRLRSDYNHYAGKCLWIRTETGSIERFVFNRVQRYIHAQLEAQRAATGKVRALILKGCQQGCSTYVGGRFYRRVTHAKDLRVFILTHDDAGTQNLCEMVDRFRGHCPELGEAVDRRGERQGGLLRPARILGI